MMMGETMLFPDRWEDFLHDYEFEDSRRIYTNGSRLIPSFRVKQMMAHYHEPVKRGQWICGYDEQADWYCSECKNGVMPSDSLGTPIECGFYYCPNCGAKMER